MSDGKRMGPVGGRIIGEVMIGLIEGDSTSYLKREPDWTSTLVPPASSQWSICSSSPAL